jgi:hypothetical protein
MLDTFRGFDDSLLGCLTPLSIIFQPYRGGITSYDNVLFFVVYQYPWNFGSSKPLNVPSIE